MKINKFIAFLAFCLATLVSYFLSSYQEINNKFILGIGCFVGLFISSVGTLALSFDYGRTTVLTKTTSAVFVILYLVSQIFFANINFTLPTYLFVNGMLIIFFLIVLYSISKSKY